MADATIIAAHLDDNELRASIDKLVSNVATATQLIRQDFDNTVQHIQRSFKTLGNVGLGGDGSSGTSSSKRTTDLKKEEQGVRDVAMSYDQMAAAQQKAVGKNEALAQYDQQLINLRNRLAEVRQDIDIYNHAIGSGKASQVSWGQEGLRAANAEAERLMKTITILESQRGNLANIVAPQGHTIQNYVNSLQKANPELAQLNEQFKRGQALMQNGGLEAQRMAAAQREFASGTNQSRQSLESLNTVVQQATQRGEEERRAFIQTGIAAQDASKQIIRAMRDQLDAGSDAPLRVKELENAYKQMRMAYYSMSATEKESPIGRALLEDIQIAQKAIAVINLYNRSFLSVSESNAVGNNSSLKSLKDTLKQLTAQYNELSVAELAAGKGDRIIKNFQETTRAAQILQKTLNRPINLKEALGGSERTLDDLNYKMQRLNSYKMGLNITDGKALGEMKQVDAEITRLKKQYDDLMGKNQSMIGSNNALARSWNYMKNRLAFYFTVGASTAFIKNLIDVRSQYELNERALGILINSAERGTQVFNELSQMALVSPYTLIELSAAAKQLVAYDIAARDVVDTTRRLADMASAVGVPMERLTYALGQIKAYGYLNSRDNRMFANAGIPLVKQLSDYYTQLEGKLVSTADVYDRIKKKAVGFNDVMQVIYKMTDEGGKFFDFQAKMADTLKVRLANLTLAWNNMLNDIGKESQGVLVSVIGGLRKLFLHWKDFDHALINSAWAGGIIVTARALNVLLIKMGFQWRILSKEMTAAGIAGTSAMGKISTFGKSIVALAKSSMTWWSLAAFWIVDVVRSILNADAATKAFNKSLRDGAQDNYKNISDFLEQYRELRDSLYKTETKNGSNILIPQDIEKGEAKKVWEAIREQIELTSRSGEEYVGKLLTIDNMSERVRQGFVLLEDIAAVNAALKDIDDNTIKVSNDWSKWWNLGMLPDGLIGNLKDYQKELDRVIEYYGTLAALREKASEKPSRSIKENEAIKEAGKSLEFLSNQAEKFQKDLQKTTDSVIDFINLKGWSGDENKINEVFSQLTTKLTLDNGLNPQQAFTLQMGIEQARSEAAKQALQIRIADENEALKAARDENARADVQARLDSLNTQLADFDKFNGVGRVHWNTFTKWMSEQHKSEVMEMFRDMNEEQIKSLQSQSAVFDPWVTKMVEKYAKEHKLSYDEAFNYLKNWIYNANHWTVFIKTVVGTEDGKSIYETLTEADTAIDTAYKKIQRLRTRQRELGAKGGNLSQDAKVREDYAKVTEEIASAEKDYNDALEKGGHSKKEDAAAKKAQKQAESELQKAFKDELQLLDKVRSQYKKLTDAGVSNGTALAMVTSQFENSISHINKILGKNGLPLFDISKFAGTDNPNKMLELLDAQLKAAKGSKNIKPSEIKDLEVKIGELKLDAKVYNTKKITDGLNNELGKLKEEYELAIELDANPELADIFTNMFDIDTSNFPRSINEYMSRVQEEFNKASQSMGYASPLDVFTADKKDWDDWGKSVEISTDALDKFKAKFVEAQNVAKKWATDVVKQTKDLEYKLADTNGKIAIEEEKLQNLKQHLAKETNEEQRRLLELQIKDQENVIAKLKEEVLQMLPTYKNLFNSIVEHSTRVTRKLAKQWKDALNNAVKNADGTYTVTDPMSGEKATISARQYGKEIGKVDAKLRETLGTFAKIKEAFTKGEDGIVDWAKGLELVAEEARKAADGMHTIADIVSELGGEDADEAVEVMNDIATSVEGLATAAGGIAQISGGDIIGGTVNVIKGVWSAVSSWFDNKNKKINKAIKESERTVNRLQNAYEALDYAVGKAMGDAETSARRATVENKKLQLAELERQLMLEKSRKKKKQDQDRIIDLEGEIASIKREIQDLTEDVVNTLLGSDVKSAAEEFVDAWVQAWRAGETTLDAMNEKMDEIMQNLIKKAITNKIVGTLLQPFYDEVDRMTSSGSEGNETLTTNELKLLAQQAGITAEEINRALGEFYGNLNQLGILSQTVDANKNLSALQQGIQSITEDTAGALEAYMNGVSQQVYYQSQILTEIRDAVVTMDNDIQLSTQAQMLLQLQQSYQVQMSIQGILEGVLNPAGRAFNVELIS